MRKEKDKEKIITHIPTRENHLTKMLGLCVTFFKTFCQVCVFVSGDPVACTNFYVQMRGVVIFPRQKTWKERFNNRCLPLGGF